MPYSAEQILYMLDQSCESYSFPMLDNGYSYLAATRMSLFRSTEDWAIVIELFGFSPRGGIPDIAVNSFASRFAFRSPPDSYNEEQKRTYVKAHPFNEVHFIYPIRQGSWLSETYSEEVVTGATDLRLRERVVQIPSAEILENYGVHVQDAPRIQIYELCRYLAHIERERVLATPAERRHHLLPEMEQILQLENWHHPNIVEGERPSESETFRQLAQVLETGDIKHYSPAQHPNTHWKNWPDGGSL